MPRTFELHVLDEVREAALILVFEHRPGLHDQPQFGLPRGLAIRPDVKPQAVWQAADQDLGVDRHLLREGVCGNRGGGRLATGRSLGGRKRNGSGEEQENGAGAAAP
jgi:hypothetical protein